MFENEVIDDLLEDDADIEGSLDLPSEDFMPAEADLVPQEPRRPKAEPIPVLLEWLPVDRSDPQLPKGLFIGSVRTNTHEGFKYESKLLEGQLNKAYKSRPHGEGADGKGQINPLARLGKAQVITHYMLMPAAVKIIEKDQYPDED